MPLGNNKESEMVNLIEREILFLEELR